MAPNHNARALWYVLHRINDNLTDATLSMTFNLYQLLNGISDSPSVDHQRAALGYLRSQGAIAFDEDKAASELLIGVDGPEFLVTTYEVTVADRAAFDALYEQHFAWNHDQINQRQITVQYDPIVGVGCLDDDHNFTVRGKNKQVFDLLYERRGNWVARDAILKAVRFRGQIDGSHAKLMLNTAITNLRKATGLSRHQLVQMNGQAMLKVK